MRDTIDMAREAGADTLMYWDTEKLKRFEALVRADEREACAKVCESEWSTTQEHIHGLMLADTIRARGNT
jgi:hypothetical protein